jgi:hypothetical protein
MPSLVFERMKRIRDEARKMVRVTVVLETGRNPIKSLSISICSRAD